MIILGVRPECILILMVENKNKSNNFFHNQIKITATSIVVMLSSSCLQHANLFNLCHASNNNFYLVFVAYVRIHGFLVRGRMNTNSTQQMCSYEFALDSKFDGTVYLIKHAPGNCVPRKFVLCHRNANIIVDIWWTQKSCSVKFM